MEIQRIKITINFGTQRSFHLILIYFFQAQHFATHRVCAMRNALATTSSSRKSVHSAPLGDPRVYWRVKGSEKVCEKEAFSSF